MYSTNRHEQDVRMYVADLEKPELHHHDHQNAKKKHGSDIARLVPQSQHAFCCSTIAGSRIHRFHHGYVHGHALFMKHGVRPRPHRRYKIE